jgi:hypothetical protein
MGQRLQIEWQETTEQLLLFYRWERNPHRKIRLKPCDICVVASVFKRLPTSSAYAYRTL